MRGNVLHEMFHAVGFLHEHQRPDRELVVASNLSQNHNFRMVPGSCMGPIDVDSISFYPDLPMRTDEWQQRIGQRRRLSEGDLRALRVLYGAPLQCSFTAHGDNYFPQVWYECTTCFGPSSAYGCCTSCVETCHRNHNVVRHELETNAHFVCDCGRNGHIAEVCSRNSTGLKQVKQSTFMCECQPRTVFCFQCSKHCHQGNGHRVVGIESSSFACCCSSSTCRVMGQRQGKQ
jgi:hypothetical protein